MAPHFAAFSFVDRITDLTPAKSARGVFAIPSDIAPFSSCLLAEAVGQLAAWVAMSQIDFRGRPVAALANETLLSGDVAPGRTLQLAVDIADCDDDAVAYSGWAQVNGTQVIELNDCLGPMLPLADFDSPDEMRERFALLCGPGAPPGRFRGLPTLPLADLCVEANSSASATLQIPPSAAFFGDHFPRRPVFPATLLLDAQIRLAMKLGEQSESVCEKTDGVSAPNETSPPRPSRMTHVKVRSFIAPGDALALRAEMTPSTDAIQRMHLSAKSGDKTIATARLELSAAKAS